jgi:hypothetical protein
MKYKFTALHSEEQRLQAVKARNEISLLFI